MKSLLKYVNFLLFLMINTMVIASETIIPIHRTPELDQSVLPESFFAVTKKNVNKSAYLVTRSPYAIFTRTIIGTCAVIRIFNPTLPEEDRSLETTLRLYVFTDLVMTTAGFAGSMVDEYITWLKELKK